MCGLRYWFQRGLDSKERSQIELPNMTVWVVRKSVEGDQIGAPRLCAKPGQVVRVPGLLTIEEQIALFLIDGESVQDFGTGGRWQVLEGNQLTGFISAMGWCLFLRLIEPRQFPVERSLDVLLPDS